VRVFYRQAASDDVVRQFRYYLVTQNLPEIAVRFRASLRLTIQSLLRHPLVGPHYRLSNPRLHNLRCWPVTGFETIRVYYLVDSDGIHVVRILHGKRDVKRILEHEMPLEG
jgi:plasmid stabilization system protein ParE